jgi:hypothetical protein
MNTDAEQPREDLGQYVERWLMVPTGEHLTDPATPTLAAAVARYAEATGKIVSVPMIRQGAIAQACEGGLLFQPQGTELVVFLERESSGHGFVCHQEAGYFALVENLPAPIRAQWPPEFVTELRGELLRHTDAGETTA